MSRFMFEKKRKRKNEKLIFMIMDDNTKLLFDFPFVVNNMNKSFVSCFCMFQISAIFIIFLSFFNLQQQHLNCLFIKISKKLGKFN